MSVSDVVTQPTRKASHLSDKQIAQAAVRGRKVTFTFFSGHATHEVSGYIVGMDSYHWMLAAVDTANFQADRPIVKSLIHKSRPDLIRLHDDATLQEEPETIRLAITKVGEPFWATCAQPGASR